MLCFVDLENKLNHIGYKENYIVLRTNYSS